MEYKSNASEVIGNLKKNLMTADQLVSSISQMIYASNLRRIHNEGRTVDGKAIGVYSRKPMYVNPKYSPKKFAPKGKTGREYFKNGKQHKTRYFKDGYTGFRRTIGRSTSVVNFQLTGTLLANWQLQFVPGGSQIGFASKKKGDIASFLEAKYHAKIWGISQQDRNNARQMTNNWLKNA